MSCGQHLGAGCAAATHQLLQAAVAAAGRCRSTHALNLNVCNTQTHMAFWTLAASASSACILHGVLHLHSQQAAIAWLLKHWFAMQKPPGSCHMVLEPHSMDCIHCKPQRATQVKHPADLTSQRRASSYQSVGLPNQPVHPSECQLSAFLPPPQTQRTTPGVTAVVQSPEDSLYRTLPYLR